MDWAAGIPVGARSGLSQFNALVWPITSFPASFIQPSAKRHCSRAEDERSRLEQERRKQRGLRLGRTWRERRAETSDRTETARPEQHALAVAR